MTLITSIVVTEWKYGHNAMQQVLKTDYRNCHLMYSMPLVLCAHLPFAYKANKANSGSSRPRVFLACDSCESNSTTCVQ